MRLVQKSLLHTGYMIFEDDSVGPIFSPHVIAEAYYNSNKPNPVKKVYAVANLEDLLVKIKTIKKSYGIIPQNYTEELRTGFRNGDGLSQTHSKFCYC